MARPGFESSRDNEAPIFLLSVVVINKITYQTQRRKLRILPSADEYLNFPFHSPHFGSLQVR